MRFLVDSQLPPALARWLSTKGHEAEHVFDLGLASATDRAIWAHATAEGATIVSKDEDFLNLAILEPRGPPIVWIRVGNTSRSHLIDVFEALLPEVERRLAEGDQVVEIA